MPIKKKPKSSCNDCPMPVYLEIPQVCFRQRNEYIDTKCNIEPIRVPKLDCKVECTTIEQPKIEIGPCELPKICLKEKIVEKPKICITQKKQQICKPCIEYQPCQLLKTKPCRIDLDIVKPCIRPVKPPKICCEPCPITIPKIKVQPIKCCVPKPTCVPVEIECPKFCEKPMNIEVPKICITAEPIKIPVPVVGPLKTPPDCPIDCPEPC